MTLYTIFVTYTYVSPITTAITPFDTTTRYTVYVLIKQTEDQTDEADDERLYQRKVKTPLDVSLKC
jgi:hypothetical protein